jgi:hypothetical protein
MWSRLISFAQENKLKCKLYGRIAADGLALATMRSLVVRQEPNGLVSGLFKALHFVLGVQLKLVKNTTARTVELGV